MKWNKAEEAMKALESARFTHLDITSRIPGYEHPGQLEEGADVNPSDDREYGVKVTLVGVDPASIQSLEDAANASDGELRLAPGDHAVIHATIV